MLSHVITAQNICLRDYPVQLLFRRGESVPKTGSDIFKLRKVLRLKVGFHPPVSKADNVQVLHRPALGGPVHGCVYHGSGLLM